MSLPSEVQTVLGEAGQRRRRRTRRRDSKARRIARALEPIGLVVALCVLSMGVIKAVEVTVPSKAEYEDQKRTEVERANMREEVRELAETLEAGWAPSFQEGEDPFFADDFADLEVEGEPSAGANAKPVVEAEAAGLTIEGVRVSAAASF